MAKKYTSLENSIRAIMEGRSAKEQSRTLEQAIIEGGHTLEEKIGPRTAEYWQPAQDAQRAAKKKENDEVSVGDIATDLALDLAPITGTYREGKRAKEAFKRGEIWSGLGHSGMTALSALTDVAALFGVGAAAGAALRGGAAATRTAKAVDTALDAAKSAETISDVAKAGDAVKAAETVAKTADAAKAADAAADAAIIRKANFGKKKDADITSTTGTGSEIIQGNTRLKPKPEEFKPTKKDNSIEVPPAANKPGAPDGINVIPFPSNKTRVPDSTPNTRVATPGQQPANLNAPTVGKPSPVAKIETPKAATAIGTGTGVRAATEKAPETKKDSEEATKKNEEKKKRKRGFGFPLFGVDFGTPSVASQGSGVGTYMHRAAAPLKVSEENEADKERISIENVARLNSRRVKAIRQQEIQRKILDEKKSLADTVKRNVEETRKKQRIESPIITNPELNRPEPEGTN